MEHLYAKSRRFFSWADKIAYTRYWPIASSHLPGEDNDISHVLSNLGDQARERQQYLTAVGATVMACPTIHSFHNAPDPAGDPLSPFHVVHLNVSEADAQ